MIGNNKKQVEQLQARKELCRHFSKVYALPEGKKVLDSILTKISLSKPTLNAEGQVAVGVVSDFIYGCLIEGGYQDE